MADTERAELIPEHAHSSSMGRALKFDKAWKWPLHIHVDPRILSASAVVGSLQKALGYCCGNVKKHDGPLLASDTEWPSLKTKGIVLPKCDICEACLCTFSLILWHIAITLA